MIEDGTAIGDGLATAVSRLKTSKAISKVIILLTDGVSNMGSLDPYSAAEIAKLFGIRIYTIGVGSEGMAAVPISRGLFGLRYENRPVKIDEALMTEIANTTGGRYFRAKDADGLQRIYEQIDALERSVVEQRAFVRYTEQFRWPLGLAMLALLMELYILARRGVLP